MNKKYINQFGEGLFPLIQYFKSLALLLAPDESFSDFCISSHEIVEWITEFDQWFKKTSGILAGERLYTAYNREITLLGCGLLQVPSSLEKITKLSSSVGFGVSLTISVDEILEHREVLDFFVRSHLISSLGVTVDLQQSQLSLDQVLYIIESLTNYKTPLGIIGSYEELKRVKLFQSQIVNATDITIYPSKQEATVSNIGIPSSPPQACANRFKLYVDYDGLIYPCFGLLGLPNQAIGSIRESFANCALAGQPYGLDLMNLALEGPKLQERNSDTRYTNLPWVCECHRSELISMEYAIA